MDELELVALLVRELGATELDPADPHRCPRCLTPTEPSPAGHRTYCLRCTVADLPGTFLDNSVRIEFGLTWTAYWNRCDKYGPAWINRVEWRTSLAKLRQRRKS